MIDMDIAMNTGKRAAIRRIFASLLLVSVICTPSFAQSRKELRRERRDSVKAARAAEALNERENEVVNTGYGTIRAVDNTGSASTVRMKKEKVVVYTDIYKYLEGKVPGVVVDRSGGTPKVRVRGTTSINSSTEPLFVVDGMRVNDISFVNPNDVDQIDVLKDAATTSLYGVQGGNGVIVITTKH